MRIHSSPMSDPISLVGGRAFASAFRSLRPLRTWGVVFFASWLSALSVPAQPTAKQPSAPSQAIQKTPHSPKRSTAAHVAPSEAPPVETPPVAPPTPKWPAFDQPVQASVIWDSHRSENRRGEFQPLADSQRRFHRDGRGYPGCQCRSARFRLLWPGSGPRRPFPGSPRLRLQRHHGRRSRAGCAARAASQHPPGHKPASCGSQQQSGPKQYRRRRLIGRPANPTGSAAHSSRISAWRSSALSTADSPGDATAAAAKSAKPAARIAAKLERSARTRIDPIPVHKLSLELNALTGLTDQPSFPQVRAKCLWTCSFER